MSCVQKEKLCISQGSDYDHTFVYTEKDGVTPIDITGFTVRMKFRPDYDDATILYEATTALGQFTIPNGIDGEIELSIPNADTTAWAFDEAVYDIEIVSPTSKVTRILQGVVVITPEVTT